MFFFGGGGGGGVLSGIAKKPDIFFIFQGVGEPDSLPPSPSGSAHETQLNRFDSISLIIEEDRKKNSI